MAITLVRVYDNYPAAEMARVELLRSGFSRDLVHLSAKEDEAGPVQGNFAVDDKDHSPGGGRKFFGGLFGRRNALNIRARQQAAEKPVQRGNFLLTVDTSNHAQYAHAADIMKRFGAIDVEQRTGGRSKAL
jgi:hypothetical protein